ncbi:site-specific DNA-methyltransferase [Aeromonas salmonicida subsp. achromogenes]|uniref:site-specific DNA-methyltransferase n=1 Tax=Aeromonas salmonicida TaxID=645 RepID=UPI0003095297|nr:site-specific DNA-methyltransferase [Aeromonas salmonicida]TMX08123.1 site-specific DNA-methyltransferase [Aeromonas salmonicida subsp. achromogenes]TMX10266.1 site-specific DNA-methyltransferase [Aeromonas salmonicida subsp. achromogenes]TMX17845.1 site-specific DNA-methyltransferase [Aeromonas salmonicida subsp. achromogenes]TMX18016.1 site-specific DNA-methyltransferase [Aeromonas salmonicida subsp. achromogenes]
MTIKEETLHSNIETVNSKQLAVLKKHFPQCFDKNGHFIQEKMLEVVNANEVELSKESYSLNWLGKSYARLLTNLPPKTLINEDLVHNQLEQNKDSKNLLIKGDNLEVLKHMVNAYSEKVKMIYIDPPYNTGSDGFVYNDDRKFTKEQLADLTGIDLDEAVRILEFTDKGSNSHSAWLTFMYPRLYIAKQLLREDGVIFISIDDSESSQMKLICDEIFGEHNFVSQLVWEKKKKGTFLSNTITSVKEYIYVYANVKEKFSGLIGEVNSSTETYPCVNASNKREIRHIPKGIKSKYREQNHKLEKGSVISASTMDLILHSDLVIEDGVLAEDLIIEGNWRYKQDVMEEYANKDELYITQDLYLRRIVDEPRYKTLKDLLPRVGDDSKSNFKDIDLNNLFSDGWGSNEDGEEELRELLGHKGLMTFPKPKKLIQKLCLSLRDKNSIAMDFFAGSGTTGQAIIHLNSLDNGSRQFVNIQISEKTPLDSVASKAGYKTIFDITKARITKAAEKIREENPDFQGDLGFKIFETVEDFRVEDDDKELSLMTMTMFDDVMLTDDQYHTLLTTWRLYDGCELTTPVQDIGLDNYTAHLCDNRLYMIASDFSSDALKALLLRLDTDKQFSPNKIVFFGKNFDSVKQMELNEALKSYANKKSLEIDLVGRN